MSFNNTLTTQLTVAGLKTFGGSQTIVDTEVVMIDGVFIDAGETDALVHVGISDTSKIQALFLKFVLTTSTYDLPHASFKVDSGDIVTTVYNNDQVAVTGTMAESLLNTLSDSTTCNDLKITTPAGMTCTVSVCAVVDPT